MTDRYYPKGMPMGPDVETMTSSYSEMNAQRAFERSLCPPGYAGHTHGTKQKFGYSNPVADPLETNPISGDDPSVNYRRGRPILYQPLPLPDLTLKNYSPNNSLKLSPSTRKTPFPALITEDDRTTSFVPQTTPFMVFLKANHGHTIDKECPWTGAFNGRGTGFNGGYTSALRPGKMECSTTARDSWVAPILDRRGLDCIELTRRLQRVGRMIAAGA